MYVGILNCVPRNTYNVRAIGARTSVGVAEAAFCFQREKDQMRLFQWRERGGVNVRAAMFQCLCVCVCSYVCKNEEYTKRIA